MAGIFDFERNDANTVAMLGNVLRNVAAGAERYGEYETNFALLQNIRSPIALAGFGTGVGQRPETVPWA